MVTKEYTINLMCSLEAFLANIVFADFIYKETFMGWDAPKQYLITIPHVHSIGMESSLA